MPHKFNILDVFAETRYTGNQLAVVRCGGALSEAEMQQIAREFNFSETTFITSEQPRDGGYDVRIFTPLTEVPFAGHPTLGTAFVVQSQMIRQPVEQIALNLKVGQIPVTFTYRQGKADVLWMRQKAPTFGRTLDAAAVAKHLGIGRDEIDVRFPIREVDTGLPFVIVPLKRLETLRTLHLNAEMYADMVSGMDAKALLLFCPETIDKATDLHVRVFAHLYGVPEDPATGSANGCLAAWLVKCGYYGKPDIDIRVEQGIEMGRPSLLYLRARETSCEIEVNVGGRVQPVAEGQLG